MQSYDIIMPIARLDSSTPASLKSILAQTYRYKLFIAVLDTVCDKLYFQVSSLLDELGFRDIRVIRTMGLGAGKARDIGLKYVTSPFVAFIDSDDVVHRNVRALYTVKLTF